MGATATTEIRTVVDTWVSCSCEKCASACERIPGVPTPIEALKMIRAGHAHRLVEVYVWPHFGSWKDGWTVLAPRGTHPDFQFAEDNRYRSDMMENSGRCTFLGGDDRCQLHYSGYKPAECRHSQACEEHPDYNERAPWNTATGRIVIKLWERELVK